MRHDLPHGSEQSTPSRKASVAAVSYTHLGWQKSVNGSFQLRLIAGAVLCGLMFNIALAFVLSGDDDGQTVFFA